MTYPRSHSCQMTNESQTEAVWLQSPCSCPTHKFALIWTWKAKGHAADFPPCLAMDLPPLLCVPGLGGDSRSQGQPGLERPCSVPAQAQLGK